MTNSIDSFVNEAKDYLSKYSSGLEEARAKTGKKPEAVEAYNKRDMSALIGGRSVDEFLAIPEHKRRKEASLLNDYVHIMRQSGVQPSIEEATIIRATKTPWNGGKPMTNMDFSRIQRGLTPNQDLRARDKETIEAIGDKTEDFQDRATTRRLEGRGVIADKEQYNETRGQPRTPEAQGGSAPAAGGHVDLSNYTSDQLASMGWSSHPKDAPVPDGYTQGSGSKGGTYIKPVAGAAQGSEQQEEQPVPAQAGPEKGPAEQWGTKPQMPEPEADRAPIKQRNEELQAMQDADMQRMRENGYNLPPEPVAPVEKPKKPRPSRRVEDVNGVEKPVAADGAVAPQGAVAGAAPRAKKPAVAGQDGMVQPQQEKKPRVAKPKPEEEPIVDENAPPQITRLGQTVNQQRGNRKRRRNAGIPSEKPESVAPELSDEQDAAIDEQPLEDELDMGMDDEFGAELDTELGTEEVEELEVPTPKPTSGKPLFGRREPKQHTPQATQAKPSTDANGNPVYGTARPQDIQAIQDAIWDKAVGQDDVKDALANDPDSIVAMGMKHGIDRADIERYLADKEQGFGNYTPTGKPTKIQPEVAAPAMEEPVLDESGMEEETFGEEIYGDAPKDVIMDVYNMRDEQGDDTSPEAVSQALIEMGYNVDSDDIAMLVQDISSGDGNFDEQVMGDEQDPMIDGQDDFEEEGLDELADEINNPVEHELNTPEMGQESQPMEQVQPEQQMEADVEQDTPQVDDYSRTPNQVLFPSPAEGKKFQANRRKSKINAHQSALSAVDEISSAENEYSYDDMESSKKLHELGKTMTDDLNFKSNILNTSTHAMASRIASSRQFISDNMSEVVRRLRSVKPGSPRIASFKSIVDIFDKSGTSKGQMTNTLNGALHETMAQTALPDTAIDANLIMNNAPFDFIDPTQKFAYEIKFAGGVEGKIPNRSHAASDNIRKEGNEWVAESNGLTYRSKSPPTKQLQTFRNGSYIKEYNPVGSAAAKQTLKQLKAAGKEPRYTEAISYSQTEKKAATAESMGLQLKTLCFVADEKAYGGNEEPMTRLIEVNGYPGNVSFNSAISQAKRSGQDVNQVLSKYNARVLHEKPYNELLLDMAEGRFKYDPTN